MSNTETDHKLTAWEAEELWEERSITESEEEELWETCYHDVFPGMTREFFGFLKNVSQFEKEILPFLRIMREHQRQFEAKTVVYTRKELFDHLVSRGYKTELATFLTENADEDMIPHWTLAQWTVAFLSYASEKKWSSKFENHSVESNSLKSTSSEVKSESSQAQKEPSPTLPPNESINLSDLHSRLDKFKNDSPHLVLCHFTTKCSVDSIQIRFSGSRCHKLSEFAVVGALYLCNSVEYGLKWLRTRYPSMEWAVMLFEVPDEYFLDHDCVHFESANDDWKRFCYDNFNASREHLEPHDLEYENDIIIGPICKFRATAPAHPDHTGLEPYKDANGTIIFQHAIVKHDAVENLMAHLTKIWYIVE